MMKQVREKIRSIREWIRTRRKWNRMDRLWRFYGGSCFGLCPPSFYHRYSKEEIERIEQEEIRKLKEKLNEFQMQNEQNA